MRFRVGESREHPQIVRNLNVVRDTETAVDGTTWKKLQTGGSSGRPLIRIFKDIVGFTRYATRNVATDGVSSST